MRALVTAELTDAAEHELVDLGWEVSRDGWAATGRELDPDELVAALAGGDALVTEHERIPGEVLHRSPDLGIVAVCRGTPVGIDLDAAAELGVTVVHTPARNADATADFTIASLLDVVRHVSASDRHLRHRGWMVDGQLPYRAFRGRELGMMTIGIVGYGAIGRRVADRARDGFGMEVLAHSRREREVDGVRFVGLDELLASSDVVSLHCATTEETTGLIGVRELAMMRPGSYLLNLARAAIVDTDALIDALRVGHLAGAAVDVFDPEPPPSEHPLFSVPNLLLTPHIAGASDDVVTHHSAMVVAELAAWHRGAAPIHPVVVAPHDARRARGRTDGRQ